MYVAALNLDTRKERPVDLKADSAVFLHVDAALRAIVPDVVTMAEVHTQRLADALVADVDGYDGVSDRLTGKTERIVSLWDIERYQYVDGGVVTSHVGRYMGVPLLDLHSGERDQVLHVAVHNHHGRYPGKQATAMEAVAQFVNEQIEAGLADTVVIAGDFNMPPSGVKELLTDLIDGIPRMALSDDDVATTRAGNALDNVIFVSAHDDIAVGCTRVHRRLTRLSHYPISAAAVIDDDEEEDDSEDD